jgi:HK97 family phage portal protein
MIPKWTSPPSRNTAEWMQSFGTNPRLAVVDKISGDLSYATGKLYRIGQNGEKTEILSHPFLDFWKRPNPLYEFTASALWRLQNNYLLLKGEGYFIIERYDNGYPAELWPVPTQWVQITPYQGFPFYTIRTTEGGLMDVSVDDMFVMKDLNPLDPYRRGLGQAEPIADEIEIDEYAAKFQKNFFYNDATPSTIISMPGASEEQQNRFLAKWRERFQGANKSHGVATIGGPADQGATVTKLSENMKDLDMINGRTFTRDTVMEHFGMPREIMGITQNSNRATADAAQYIYATNVLTPRLMGRQDAINLQLLLCYGNDLLWEFDDIIPKDKEYEKGLALDGWNAGLLLMNESRKKMDMESVKNGNIYKMGFADMFIGEGEDRVKLSSESANLQYSDIPEPIEADRNDIEIVPWQDDVTLEEEKVLARASQIKARRIQTAGQSLDAVRRNQSRKFEFATIKYLKNQSKQIRGALLGTKKAEGTVWDALDMTQEEFQQLSQVQQQELTMQFVNGLLDWKSEASVLESILTPLWAETYDKGADNVAATYRMEAMQRPAMTSTARIRGGQRVTRVTQTTKGNISRIINDGLSNGKSYQELTEEIMDEMNTSAERARVIAAQECNTSLLAGNYDMAKSGGFTTKTWHVTNISKARDTHKGLNGKTVSINEPFITDRGNKLMMPCDPDCSVAEETVSCHCFLTYS